MALRRVTILPTGQGDDCVSHKKGEKVTEVSAKQTASGNTNPSSGGDSRVFAAYRYRGQAGKEICPLLSARTLDCVLPRPELAPPTSTTANFPSPRIFPSRADRDPREPPPTWEPHFERPSRLCMPSVGAVSWSFRLISVLTRPRAACAHCRRAPCSALPLSSGRQSSSPTSLKSQLNPVSHLEPTLVTAQHRFTLTRYQLRVQYGADLIPFLQQRHRGRRPPPLQ